MKNLLFLLLSLNAQLFAQTKILFDASKAQMTSNADWVIDADVFNLGLGNGGIMQAGQSNEANPQRYPTPAQSGITSTTLETYWDGAISAWGVDLVKLGYQVETLPYNKTITYGNTSNVQDLSNYKVFISDEPNIKFSAAEKTALLQFVKHGGGLFMIADHDSSDRNFDGWDSPHIWNSLMDTNTVQARAFGITFDYQDFNQTSSNVASLPNDSCLHNPAIGNATKIKISGGTTITVNHANNISAKGLIFKTGANTTGTTQILLASARFGTGKVAALSDSSPPDDGTGDPNDNLFFSYTGEASGNHRIFLLNTTIWLATTDSVATPTGIETQSLEEGRFLVFPNPAKDNISIVCNGFAANQVLQIFDVTGREIYSQSVTDYANGIMPVGISGLTAGAYFVKMNNHVIRFLKTGN